MYVTEQPHRAVGDHDDAAGATLTVGDDVPQVADVLALDGVAGGTVAVLERIEMSHRAEGDERASEGRIRQRGWVGESRGQGSGRCSTRTYAIRYPDPPSYPTHIRTAKKDTNLPWMHAV